MTNLNDLIKRAEAVNKGVKKDDGYDYLVPAADIAETNAVIEELVDKLKKIDYYANLVCESEYDDDGDRLLSYDYVEGTNDARSDVKRILTPNPELTIDSLEAIWPKD